MRNFKAVWLGLGTLMVAGYLCWLFSPSPIVHASGILALPATVVQTNQSNTYTTGTQNFAAAVHTVPTIVVATTGALPASGCVNGELAVVTGATPGQQIYENSATGSCMWTQQLNTGSSSGGGVITYSGPAVSLTGTLFFPAGGGGAPSGTEGNVDLASSSAGTITNLSVQMSGAPGMGNSVAVTWRKNNASQSSTCTISGAVATECQDTTHSFNVSQGDLLDYQIIVSGVVAGTPTLAIMSQFGTTQSGGTVNTGTAGQFGYYAANGTAISTATGMTTHGVVLYEGTSAPGSTGALAVDTLLQGQGAGADPAGVGVNNCATALTYATSTHMFGCATPGPTANQNIRSFGAAFDGGGSALTSGKTTYFTMPFACTITGYNITADAGTVSFDVWKVATGTAIPVVGNSILTGGFLALSSGTALHSTSVTLFTTTAVAAFDIIGVNLQAVATATVVSLVIPCNAT